MSGWEPQAEQWLAWARTPGHDSYWAYRDSFFEVLPEPGGATLDVGCGEGRLARDLAKRGHRVTGLDASPSLIEHAREADRDGHFCACVIHPLVNAGSWAGDGTFVVDRSYFEERSVEMAFERDGLQISFTDRTYPLEAYARELSDARLLIDTIREPRAPLGYRSYERWSRLPVFLHLRAVKP